MNDWLILNKDLESISQKVTASFNVGKNNPVEVLFYSFLSKSNRTLMAINILYDKEFFEQAQALVRVIFESRVNYDYFTKMGEEKGADVVRKVLDSMMIEKIKQARSTDYIGMVQEQKNEVKTRFDNLEKDFIDRYSAKEYNKMKKYGFSGISFEERCKRTGHESIYNMIYRNFSRNVHSTDYSEHMLPLGILNEEWAKEYKEHRNYSGMFVTHLSAGGILVDFNQRFNCGFEKDLESHLDKKNAIESKRRNGRAA